MKLESAKGLLLHAAKATGKGVLRALFYAGITLVIHAALLFVFRSQWSAMSAVTAGLMALLLFAAAPIAFGWIGWIQSLTQSAAQTVERFAPDIANVVFTRLAERVGDTRLDAGFEMSGADAKAWVEKLGTGSSWMAGLPKVLSKLLRLARRLSSPVDLVAQTLGTFVGRKVSMREVLGQAQAEFQRRLPDAVPQPAWIPLIGLLVVDVALWAWIVLGRGA